MVLCGGGGDCWGDGRSKGVIEVVVLVGGVVVVIMVKLMRVDGCAGPLVMEVVLVVAILIMI